MKKQAKESTYPYPSRFGSHRSMVKQEDECTFLGPPSAFDGPIRVICIDEYGEYSTTLDRLDSGLADPNRYNANRIGKLFESKKKDDK